MRSIHYTFLICLMLLLSSGQSFANEHPRLVLPEFVIGQVEQQLSIESLSDSLMMLLSDKTIALSLNGTIVESGVENGRVVFHYHFPEKEQLFVEVGGMQLTEDVNPVPLWMSVLPPLVAILLALLLKEVFTALFTGIMVGTSIMYFYQGVGFFTAIGKGFLAVMDTYVLESLMDKGHLSIIIFSMVIGGMVQLISANGGMKGVVNRLSGFATSARSGQFVTWMMGVIIFFDDYANTLVVGNTMRPVADRLKISREKLAYIVDSTAAPVAAVAFVTTWIGAELSYIQDGLNVIGLEMSAYNVFFNSLAYSYYPWLTIGFVLMLIYSQRDFGPMRKAERKAFDSPQTDVSPNTAEPEGDPIPQRAMNAVIPVLVIIFGTIAGLLYTGWDQQVWSNNSLTFTTKISEIIGLSDSYAALLWSSISALIVAIVLTSLQRLMSLQKMVDSIVDGFRTMLTAILILTLAWSVALVTQHMHTADFLAYSLMELSFSPYLIPAFTFVLAALVAFSTGTSWGTMAILYPLLLPASWMLTEQASYIDHAHGLTIFYSVVSAVLSGSILGDHISPISDTTILSSISSGCNHIAHVRTQMPYALTVGFIAVFLGTIPAAYGFISPLVLLLVALVVLWVIIRFVGKKNPIQV